MTVVLSYNVTPEELFDLFGKFGPVRYVQEPTHDFARSKADNFTLSD